MIRYGKKEQNVHSSRHVRHETVLGFEVSNTRSNNPPCIWVEYCERCDSLKFWINRQQTSDQD